MAKLSAAQSRALEIIKRDYGLQTFSKPHDEAAKRDVSSATIRKLYQLGYIEHVSTNDASYYIREGAFGRGNYIKKPRYENVWRLKREID